MCCVYCQKQDFQDFKILRKSISPPDKSVNPVNPASDRLEFSGKELVLLINP